MVCCYSKLKKVKVALKSVNAKNGNLIQAVLNSRDELLKFQDSMGVPPSSADLRIKKELANLYSSALPSDGSFLKQKSRIHWLKNGDGNNRYFMNSCKNRWNSNKVLFVVDDYGNTHVSHENIVSVDVSYFKNVLELLVRLGTSRWTWTFRLSPTMRPLCS